jgi:hypothetical protein
VLKDPRITLLLPLWRRATLDRAAAALVVRDPLEVAWSLALRDGMHVVTGLALWAAYNRAALAGLAGLPVHVLRYERLVAEPGPAVAEMVDTLVGVGELPPGTDPAPGAAAVRPDLRRATWAAGEPDPVEVPAELVELEKLLDECSGGHASFEPPAVAGPAWWERALLDERRRAGVRLAEAERRAAELVAQELSGEGSRGWLRAERDSLRAGRDAERHRADRATVRAEEAERATTRAEAERAATVEALATTRDALAAAEARWARLERRPAVRALRRVRRLFG